ncbi:MAG: GTPase Era [Clostridia bacterium]|nr:GTPase Era [Clostridia bacterium]
MSKAPFKSGFITIIGSPNVGKSTLMNLLVGQKVSIVSERAQTTRNRIAGVVTRPNYQIVFLDTPGVTGAKNRLGEYMLRVAYESLSEVEAILFMLDASKGVREMDESLIAELRRRAGGTPVIAAINKTDLVSFDGVETVRERLEKESFIKHIVPISASTGRNVEKLESVLASYLVEGPMFYPEDMVTDQPMRVITAEIIREKALKSLRQEIPHGIGVDIERIALREDGINDISAVIYCERDSHKGIIIGGKGAMLKKIGSAARPEIETLFGTKVNLQLWVKVRPDWRNSANALRELGYNED